MHISTIVKEWLIPPGITKSIRALKSKYIDNTSDEPAVKKKLLPNQFNDLSTYKNNYNGKRCFILATGPSIQNQDLTILEGEYCIAVSMFHLHKHIQLIKPKWHVLAPSHPPFKFDVLKTIYESLYNSYEHFSDINFLIGHVNYNFSHFDYLAINNNQFATRFLNNIHFVDYNNSASLNEENFNKEEVWDLTKRPFSIRTVIYSAIQLANYLGFSEIVLVGCDHDYLNDINRVENHHFYDEKKGFSDKEHLSLFNKERWFLEYHYRWKDYRLMNEYFTSKGLNIVNATNGGMLDIFPRKRLEDFFI